MLIFGCWISSCLPSLVDKTFLQFIDQAPLSPFSCPLDCLCIFVAVRISSTTHLVSALYTFQHNLGHMLIIKYAANIDEMHPKSMKCSQS